MVYEWFKLPHFQSSSIPGNLRTTGINEMSIIKEQVGEFVNKHVYKHVTTHTTNIKLFPMDLSAMKMLSLCIRIKANSPNNILGSWN
jgi:hypothetical protein